MYLFTFHGSSRDKNSCHDLICGVNGLYTNLKCLSIELHWLCIHGTCNWSWEHRWSFLQKLLTILVFHNADQMSWLVVVCVTEKSSLVLKLCNFCPNKVAMATSVTALRPATAGVAFTARPALRTPPSRAERRPTASAEGPVCPRERKKKSFFPIPNYSLSVWFSTLTMICWPGPIIVRSFNTCTNLCCNPLSPALEVITSRFGSELSAIEVERRLREKVSLLGRELQLVRAVNPSEFRKLSRILIAGIFCILSIGIFLQHYNQQMRRGDRKQHCLCSFESFCLYFRLFRTTMRIKTWLWRKVNSVEYWKPTVSRCLPHSSKELLPRYEANFMLLKVFSPNSFGFWFHSVSFSSLDCFRWVFLQVKTNSNGTVHYDDFLDKFGSSYQSVMKSENWSSNVKSLSSESQQYVAASLPVWNSLILLFSIDSTVEQKRRKNNLSISSFDGTESPTQMSTEMTEKLLREKVTTTNTFGWCGHQCICRPRIVEAHTTHESVAFPSDPEKHAERDKGAATVRLQQRRADPEAWAAQGARELLLQDERRPVQQVSLVIKPCIGENSWTVFICSNAQSTQKLESPQKVTGLQQVRFFCSFEVQNFSSTGCTRDMITSTEGWSTTKISSTDLVSMWRQETNHLLGTPFMPVSWL